MLKKHFKSIVLVFLVLTAFFLASQIWFSSYLLPDGYNYFVSGFQKYIVRPITGLFHGRMSTDFSENFQALSRPEKVVINVSGERRSFRDGQKNFEEALRLADETMSHFLSGDYDVKSREVVTMDAYNAVLRGKSIYVDYGKNYDYNLFSVSVCGQAKNRFSDDLSVVKGYIISLQDSIMNDISVFIMDQKSSNIYRYVIEADKNELDSRMATLLQTTPAGHSLSYSFELNFHKEQTEIVSKVLFEPMILMELTPVSLAKATAVTPGGFDQTVDAHMLDTVLRMFSINTRTMWRYMDLTGARVFVENDATLTLYPDGYLEYQTVGNGKGLDISADKSGYDIYAATSDAVDFVTELCSYMPPEIFEHLRITSDLTNDSAKQGFYRICFDYCIDGIPVRCQSTEGQGHTIELEIEGGYLKSYRQHVTTYELNVNETLQTVPMLSAADFLVDDLYDGKTPLYIDKLSVCYVEKENGQLASGWRAVVDGREYIVE